MSMSAAATSGKDNSDAVNSPAPAAKSAPAVKPTEAQRRYLTRGLTQPGGKLPLFDRDGREVPKKTIESCVQHGWAQPWTHNPIKPDWLVCRLTAAGYQVLGAAPPEPAAPAANPKDC
jgi:hypothetical protein